MRNRAWPTASAVGKRENKIRIQQIEAEITELRVSELFTLKTRVEEGSQNGKDVLGEMVERLKGQIQTRREHLRSL